LLCGGAQVLIYFIWPNRGLKKKKPWGGAVVWAFSGGLNHPTRPGSGGGTNVPVALGPGRGGGRGGIGKKGPLRGGFTRKGPRVPKGPVGQGGGRFSWEGHIFAHPALRVRFARAGGVTGPAPHKIPRRAEKSPGQCFAAFTVGGGKKHTGTGKGGTTNHQNFFYNSAQRAGGAPKTGICSPNIFFFYSKRWGGGEHVKKERGPFSILIFWPPAGFSSWTGKLGGVGWGGDFWFGRGIGPREPKIFFLILGRTEGFSLLC